MIVFYLPLYGMTWYSGSIWLAFETLNATTTTTINEAKNIIIIVSLMFFFFVALKSKNQKKTIKSNGMIHL